MTHWQIALACATGALALLGGVYTAFAARGRGPILSHTYLWKGKAERRRADKRAEYRLVAVIFGGLTAFFALETVHILTLSKIPFLLALCALGFDMVYAVADAVKSGKNSWPRLCAAKKGVLSF